MLTVLSALIIFWQTRQETGDPSTIPTDKLLETRRQLLRRLQADVGQRLSSSLHNLIKIDLQMEDRRQQVGQPFMPLVPEDPTPSLLDTFSNRVLQVFANTPTASLKPTQKIVEVFNHSDIQGKLLILGEPGAGKTTELLTLAQDLLQQALNDEGFAIPIIFELSAWKEDKPILHWLIEQITSIYRIPASTGREWVETQQLLPLLDGWDELGLDRQKSCIKRINQYLIEYTQSRLVVCCRREEYEQGQDILEELQGAIYLQPLTSDQSKEYLRQLNRESLWQAVQQSSELQNLARFPLFLTMLVYAYQG